MRLNQTLIILSIACIFLSGCAMNSKAPSPQKGQHPNKMSRQVMLEMDYLLYLPENYNEQDKQWPLIVFLHGAGERGDDLDLVKLHGPPMLAEEGRDFEFIIASPQCPTSHWWPRRVEHVMVLIDELTETYQVDESRIYLTGLSMGGFGTWSTASAYPERFAAIAVAVSLILQKILKMYLFGLFMATVTMLFRFPGPRKWLMLSKRPAAMPSSPFTRGLVTIPGVRHMRTMNYMNGFYRIRKSRTNK